VRQLHEEDAAVVATRLLRFLGDLPKVYEGTARLGVETTTLDADGDVVREAPVHVDEPSLRGVLAALTGDLAQVPPAYSAIKVGGERLYRAARDGREVEAPTRPVHVDAFDLTRFAPPYFEFRVQCSSGTYVRSLVRDAGTAVGCGAHLTALRRTAIGPFRVEDAVPPDPGTVPVLLPLEAAVAHLAAITLHEEEAKVAVHGCCLGPAGLAGPYRAIAPDGRLIGIYRDDGAKAVPEIILAPA